jgi:hypothetical protein
MEAVIDRIEGKIAVLELEGETFIEIPVKFLPKGVKDGDVLKISIEVDYKAKEEKLKKVKELQDKLRKKK